MRPRDILAPADRRGEAVPRRRIVDLENGSSTTHISSRGFRLVYLRRRAVVNPASNVSQVRTKLSVAETARSCCRSRLLLLGATEITKSRLVVLRQKNSARQSGNRIEKSGCGLAFNLVPPSTSAGKFSRTHAINFAVSMGWCAILPVTTT